MVKVSCCIQNQQFTSVCPGAFCCGCLFFLKGDVVKIGAYIYWVLVCMGAYYPDFMECIPNHGYKV